MAAAAELLVLDGRYQVLRRLGGSPNAPLMLASDLRRGVVVCLRLKRFTTAMAHLAAVPRLAAVSAGDDGPLLPFDFGVDGDVAYLVCPYAAGVSLETRLGDAAPLAPLDALRIVTGAGQALLVAAAQGFAHPGLQARHVLITASGAVRVAGFATLAPPARPPDGRALAALLRAALARPARVDVPDALRRLLVTVATWERRGFPPLAAVVHELARTEARLSGRTRPAVAFRAGGRAVRGVGRRLGRLGPLLRPYLVLAGLLAGTAALSAEALAARGGTNHVLVYAVAPAPAAADVAPRPIVIAATAPRTTSAASTAETAATTATIAFVAERSSVSTERTSTATTGADAATAEMAAAPQAAGAARTSGEVAPATVAARRETATETRTLYPRAAPAPARAAAAQQPAASVARRGEGDQPASDAGRGASMRAAATSRASTATATTAVATAAITTTAATTTAAGTSIRASATSQIATTSAGATAAADAADRKAAGAATSTGTATTATLATSTATASAASAALPQGATTQTTAASSTSRAVTTATARATAVSGSPARR